MKECKRKLRANGSGQLLIVAALAIALIISSTTIYVYELSKGTESADSSSIGDFVLALKQGTKNTVIGSLANISNGGEKTMLTANLNELAQGFRSLSHSGICQLDFTVPNDSLYDSGVLLSWELSDLGVSSAYTDFALKVYGTTANITAGYAVNITTTVEINGHYTDIGGDDKLVNLTCTVYNEGEPALAKNMSLFYEALGNWAPVDSSNNLSMIDYGNGTCAASFIANVSTNSVLVSAHVHDLRDIFVQANTTCYQT